MPSQQWKLLPAPPPGFSDILGVPSLWATILFHRGITTKKQLEIFLEPSQELLLDPFLLPGMKDGVARLQKAIDARETVGVFGDFDADGVTATALLYQALTETGLSVVPYIPHRVSEGHGLNAGAVVAMRDQGVTLLVTVDCGVSSIAEIEQARNYGIETIITDHHLPPPDLPPALAIINPRVPGAIYPFLDLTGAGLAFKLAQGLAEARAIPWDPSLLELAAIGTLGDLAPLLGENRYLVKTGIAELRRTERPGLQALCQQANLNPQDIDARAIGFNLSPRLNAAGRIEHAWSSFRLLITSSTVEAETLAQELEIKNRYRQQLTTQHVEQSLGLVEGQEDQPILIVESEEFYPGIIGLVASRLVDEFSRPAVVIALEEELGRASARSVVSFNIVAAISQCQELLERFGGHSQAAGFVIRRDHLPDLRRKLRNLAAAELEVETKTATLDIDAQVSPQAFLGETYDFLRSLEPYGVGNPPPIFLTRHMEVVDARLVGKQRQHVMLKVRDGTEVWNAIAFRQGNRWQPGAKHVDIVYTPNEDNFNPTGRPRLTVLDFHCRQ